MLMMMAFIGRTQDFSRELEYSAVVWMFQGGIFVYDHKLQMFDVALHWLSIPDIIWETQQVRLKNTDIFESLTGPFRICSAK